MKNKAYILSFLFIAIQFSVCFSQDELPPIEVYTTKDYNAGNQNWSITQAENRYVYVANNKGLLEFNGAVWTLYNSPNETVIRSVTAINERIYTGCYMEFGYWSHNQFGTLDYTSLSKTLQQPLIEDEQFWNIIGVDDWVLFQSLNRIYIYNISNQTIKVIECETEIVKMYKVGNSIYFQKYGKGLFKLENGLPKLVSNHEVLKSSRIVNVFQQGQSLLIHTQSEGLFVYNNDELRKWNIPANVQLSNFTIYSSIQLKDNSFALGTISNGLLHLTEDGIINYSISHEDGLGNNTVLSLMEDVDNNIWLGLDNGVNCVNITSPFRIYNDIKGDLGTVYCSAVYNGNLYLGTNQGLFYKNEDSNEAFKFIKGTKGQVWCLRVVNDQLFCGHNMGTYVVENDSAQLVSNVQGTWDIQSIKDAENLLLQGNYNGLNILEKTSLGWTFRNKIEGFNNSSKYFEQSQNNEILVSHEYKGVFKIKVDDALTKVIKLTKDSTVDKGYNSSLVKFNNSIFYAYKKGVFKYDSENSTFQRDSIYSKLFNEQSYTSGKLIAHQNTNRLWSFSDKELNYLTPGKLSHIPEIHSIALPSSLRNEMTGYENISYLYGQKYLLGSSSGYIVVDLEKLKERKFKIDINTIKMSALDGDQSAIDKSVSGNFENKENNLTFSYSISEFNRYSEAEYQYQLKGIYDNWSSWSNHSEESFKNLPYGNYTFNVRGRVGNTITTNVASYNFTIAKPWYITNTMIVLYVLGVALFSFFMHNVYKNYYKKQREKLLERTQRELDLKKLENEQQLMAFKNEKLQQDIDNKNRELAISTMSLIKKNEFLNSIKDELKAAQEGKGLKPVIKIIDKNLNNTDDWKLFQEAFNNADKDFLKKIKAKHPSLTPNDLRLCAYLRLNLSSKEIAPLLNISPRSVEVKRYRLRKKMELEHDVSLTNYILDL